MFGTYDQTSVGGAGIPAAVWQIMPNDYVLLLSRLGPRALNTQFPEWSTKLRAQVGTVAPLRSVPQSDKELDAQIDAAAKALGTVSPSGSAKTSPVLLWIGVGIVGLIAAKLLIKRKRESQP